MEAAVMNTSITVNSASCIVKLIFRNPANKNDLAHGGCPGFLFLFGQLRKFQPKGHKGKREGEEE